MKKNISETADKRVCAFVRILFAVFLFLYFYVLQSDVLALVQHRLSEGRTAYHDLWGAIILTGLLTALQVLVQRLVQFRPGAVLLSFVPSALLAVLLTAFLPGSSPAVPVLSLVLFLLWLPLCFVLRRQKAGASSAGTTVSLLTSRLTQLLPLLAYIGIAGNTNDILHYELYAARQLSDGKPEQALEAGRHSLATSPRLTALRAYALSRTDASLGDRLFEYPLPAGGSEILLLRHADTLSTLFSPDSLSHLLHLRPRESEAARPYLEHTAQRTPDSAARDYWLCALLLDKDLDSFARELPRYYPVNDSTQLPLYYAQAIILYQRLRTRPSILWRNEAISANYRDFQETGRRHRHPTERSNQLRRTYGDTYWWYYFYGPHTR